MRNKPHVWDGRYETPLGCALSERLDSDSPHSIEIVATLLRAGASLDHCGGMLAGGGLLDDINWTAEERIAGCHIIKPWHECATLIVDFRAAGSWKALERVPRKKVIVLRSLHTRGRATTTDPIMKFLCGLGDNGVVWNVLSFWRARLY